MLFYTLRVLTYSIKVQICKTVHLNHSIINRFSSTTMTSINDEESLKTKQEDNLLSKRFIGLERNIW